MEIDILEKVGELYVERAAFSEQIHDVVVLVKDGKYGEARALMIQARDDLMLTVSEIDILLRSLALSQPIQRIPEKPKEGQTALEV